MQLTSTAFKHNEPIPARYTCDDTGARPPLVASGVPPQARALAIIVDDLDARSGGWNFLHWIAWNIDPLITEIAEDDPLVGAIEGKTSFGTYHWGAPCPPKGAHRYRFRLFALDALLQLNQDANAEDLEEAMNGHLLGEAELIGTYRRA